MLEADQPVRDGTWTTAEIELINEKVCEQMWCEERKAKLDHRCN